MVFKSELRMIRQFDDVLEYVQKLCDKIRPEIYEDDTCLLCGPSRLPHTFAYRYNENSIEYMPDKDVYMLDEELMNAVQSYGLDTDKFWMAMVFIYDYITVSCTNAHKHEKSIAEKLFDICNILENDGATLTAKCSGHKNIVLKSRHDREILVEGIRELLEIKRNDHFGNVLYFGRPIDLSNEGTVTESDTRQIVFGARLYQKLFEILGVADVRKRGTNEFRLDKMTLISRFLYLTGIARNDSYNLNNERLKKDMADYKDVKINTYSNIYL